MALGVMQRVGVRARGARPGVARRKSIACGRERARLPRFQSLARCQTPPPQINNIKYALGYDWDTVLPGAAALLVSLDLEPVSKVAAGWLEGYILAKWQDTESKCPKESYANVCYTPKGLAYYADWWVAWGGSGVVEGLVGLVVA